MFEFFDFVAQNMSEYSPLFISDQIPQVTSVDEKHRVGTIRKNWSGFAREIFTVSDTFGINFPRDLDVKIKAVLLGATILIVSIMKIFLKNIKYLYLFRKKETKKKRNITIKKGIFYF